MNASSSDVKRTPTDRTGLVVGLIMAIASALIPGLDTSGGGVSAEEQPTPTAQVEAQDQLAGDELRDLISQLQVAPEGPRDGYDRGLFKHWVDADGDGCDTREEVLIAESLVPATQGDGCSVTGEWLSVYDSTTFVAPGGMDIDHMVPLGEAWDSDASSWDSARREAYANDLDHPEALIAVSASSNRSKGDRDPAEWKPENVAYWCQYAFDWITVKMAWELAADAKEIEALNTMIATCDEGQVPE
jgi:hypothetical protein